MGSFTSTMRGGVSRARRRMRIAAFDVDGTLLDGQLGRPLLRRVLDAGIVSRDDLAPIGRHLASMAPDGFEDAGVIAETYRLYGQTLRGVSCDAIDALVNEAWEGQRDDLFGFVRPLVADLRDAGFVPMLISGGIHELVGLLAADLGIDRYRGMRLERAAGVFTGRVAPAAGAPKHEVAHALAGGRSIRWSQSVAVGDSLPDADLLGRVGHPYAFEPTPALAARAREHGWTITGRETVRPLVRARLGLRTVGSACDSVGSASALSLQGG
ncbi:MAG TPA: haloacid dehalogenase-like hydrolase [Solirubrobacteraceae bacterium]|nr:haloacid dehalogenase-like hydrolase [Solirubrobacteraceae bacterium]